MLHDIAKMIIPDKEQIIITNDELNHNYTANAELLNKLNLDLIGLEKSLLIYGQKIII